MDWRLYSTLVLKALLPTSYLSVRLHLLGELPSTSGVIIASQVVWLSLMFKVLQELVKLWQTGLQMVEHLEITFNLN